MLAYQCKSNKTVLLRDRKRRTDRSATFLELNSRGGGQCPVQRGGGSLSGAPPPFNRHTPVKTLPSASSRMRPVKILGYCDRAGNRRNQTFKRVTSNIVGAFNDDLILKTLKDLKDGAAVKIPVYNTINYTFK